MANPIETLYLNYTDNTKASYKYCHSVDELYKHTEIHALLDELLGSIHEDEENAFKAGFNTAVQLLMGSSTI